MLAVCDVECSAGAQRPECCHCAGLQPEDTAADKHSVSKYYMVKIDVRKKPVTGMTECVMLCVRRSLILSGSSCV